MKMGHAIYKRRYRDLLFVTLVYWCIAGFSPSPPHLNRNVRFYPSNRATIFQHCIGGGGGGGCNIK